MRLKAATAVGILAITTFTLPSATGADPLFGARGGYNTGQESALLGGELITHVAPSVYFNPNVEVVFVGEGSYLSFNADFHYDLPGHRRNYVWLGAGLAVIAVDPPGRRNRDSSLAANFLLGVGFGHHGTVPYVQAKLVAKDDTEASLAFGLRF